MTLEENIRTIRHLNQHVIELRENRFSKQLTYLREIVEARRITLEMAHDMVYVMREKSYKGYENMDFCFDLTLPKKIEKHEIGTYIIDQFTTALRVKNRLEFFEARNIALEVIDAEEQMNILSKVIIDLSVAIELFKKYYNVEEDFDNIII